MLNRAVLMGRLTRDPELRHTQNSLPVASFTLACDRGYVSKGEERQADFIDIVCWRNQAEFVSKYFRKGMLVAVSGRIQQRTWTDREGKTRYQFEIVADEVHFAEPKRQNDAPGSGFQGSDSESPSYAPTKEYESASGFHVIGEDDGELPF